MWGINIASGATRGDGTIQARRMAVRVTPAPAKVLASRTEREYSIGATEAAVGIALARAAASVTGLAERHGNDEGGGGDRVAASSWVL